MSVKLTYPQWFVLLALKHFSPCRAGRVLRRNTLDALVRRRWADEKDGLFSITDRGVAVENFHETAPRCRHQSRSVGKGIEHERQDAHY